MVRSVVEGGLSKAAAASIQWVKRFRAEGVGGHRSSQLHSLLSQTAACPRRRPTAPGGTNTDFGLINIGWNNSHWRHRGAKCADDVPPLLCLR